MELNMTATPASAGSGVYRQRVLNSTVATTASKEYDQVESLVFAHCLDHGMAPLTELYQGELILPRLCRRRYP